MLERCVFFCRLPQIPLKTALSSLYIKHFPYCAIPLRKQANEKDCARQIQHATANGKIAAGRSLFLTQSEEGYVF